MFVVMDCHLDLSFHKEICPEKRLLSRPNQSYDLSSVVLNDQRSWKKIVNFLDVESSLPI